MRSTATTIGSAVGIIMPAIITLHMANRNSAFAAVHGIGPTGGLSTRTPAIGAMCIG